jgi:hypothetical protein
MSVSLKLVVACLVIAVAGCSDMCANTIVAEKSAPGSQHQAVLFERNCGATTDFSTQISVLPVGTDPVDVGNVFIISGGPQRKAEWGGPWAEIEWESPTGLLIRYDAGAEVSHRTIAMDDVTVAYEPVSEPPL